MFGEWPTNDMDVNDSLILKGKLCDDLTTIN